MPGVYFHLCEAKLITRYIHSSPRSFPFTGQPGWENDFTIGSILPDASPREFKYKTHFWHPRDFSHVVIAPSLEAWLNTYPNAISHPQLIGYLSHLHLDRQYFTRYLPRHVRFINASGNEEKELAQVTEAVIIRTGEHLPVRQFFSPEYFYGDYIRINPYLVEKYHLSMPAYPVGNWPIQETDLSSYKYFCKVASQELVSEQRFRPIQIFDRDDFEQFLSTTARQFVDIILTNLLNQ